MAAPAGTLAQVKIGDTVIDVVRRQRPPPTKRRRKDAAFDKALGAALEGRRLSGEGRPGADQQADGACVILSILVIYVTMVYGPIAAMLVELFPTRIRYTSMSLPYHIGNGWFGGFLPATAFAIVAATGNIYSGLWYPIVDRR